MALHEELRDAIATLEGVLSQSERNDEALAQARLRLTRASSRRRALIDCEIFPKLHDVSPEDTRKICDLRDETAALRVQSSEHIGRWTMRAIAADWAGYRQESAKMRAAMRRRIDRESAILYPLLKQLADRQAA